MPRLDGDNCNVFAGAKCNGVNRWVRIEMCHMWVQETCNAVEGIWGMYVKTPRPTPSRKTGSDVIFILFVFLVARTCKHYERRASGLTSMYFYWAGPEKGTMTKHMSMRYMFNKSFWLDCLFGPCQLTWYNCHRVVLLFTPYLGWIVTAAVTCLTKHFDQKQIVFLKCCDCIR